MIAKWTIEAEHTYKEILNYLLKNWTRKEVEKFTNKIFKIIRFIQSDPYMYKSLESHLNIRKAKVSKQTSLIYLVKKNRIELLFFWNEYKNPETLEKILSSH